MVYSGDCSLEVTPDGRRGGGANKYANSPPLPHFSFKAQ